MKKITKIYEEEGTKYRFDSDKLMLFVNKKKFQEQKKGDKVTKASIMEDLANEMFVSVDAVKSWMYGYNGPSEIDQVKALGEFFHVDYHSMLKMGESKMERTNVMNEAQAQITKDCVRTIYKKMVGFVERVRDAWDDYEYMLIYDEVVSQEQAGAIVSSISEKKQDLRAYMIDILRTIEYDALDLPVDFSERLESYIWDRFSQTIEVYDASPLHKELAFSCFDDEEVDGEGTNNGENSIMSEETKSEMEAFSEAIDWEENYYEESYRDDFKKLFADFMI